MPNEYRELKKIATLWNIDGKVIDISMAHGIFLITIPESEDVQVIDLKLDKPRIILKGKVKFGKDKNTILHLNTTGEFIIFDTITMNIQQRISLPDSIVGSNINDFEVDSDNKHLFALSRGKYKLFLLDISTGQIISEYDLNRSAWRSSLLKVNNLIIVSLPNLSNAPPNSHRFELILDAKTGKILNQSTKDNDIYIVDGYETALTSQNGVLILVNTSDWSVIHRFDSYKLKQLNFKYDQLLLESKQSDDILFVDLRTAIIKTISLSGKYIGESYELFTYIDNLRFVPILSNEPEQKIILVDMLEGQELAKIRVTNLSNISVTVASDGSSMIVKSSEKDVLIQVNDRTRIELPTSFISYGKNDEIIILQSGAFNISEEKFLCSFDATDGYFTSDLSAYVLPIKNKFKTMIFDGETFEEIASLPLNLGPWIHYPIGTTYHLNNRVMVWHYTPLRVGEITKICIDLRTGKIIGLEHENFDVIAQDSNYFITTTDHFIEIYGLKNLNYSVAKPRPEGAVASIISRELNVFELPEETSPSYQPQLIYGEIDVHWAGQAPQWEWFIIAVTGKSADEHWVYNVHFDGWIRVTDLHFITPLSVVPIVDNTNPIDTLKH